MINMVWYQICKEINGVHVMVWLLYRVGRTQQLGQVTYYGEKQFGWRVDSGVRAMGGLAETLVEAKQIAEKTAAQLLDVHERDLPVNQPVQLGLFDMPVEVEG